MNQDELNKTLKEHQKWLKGKGGEKADLRGPNLRWADLSGANLRWANLRWANLRWANLRGANLSNAIGNMRELKSMQLEGFAVCYSKTDLAIGCQQHPIEDWWSFTDEQIEEMQTDISYLWHKWKPLLKQIIEMSPAD